MKRSAIPSLILFALVVTMVSPASAQQDISNLLNRIERLERELSDVQRSVYAGGTTAPKADVDTSGSVAADDTASVNAPTALARIEIKLQRLEADLRAITGRAEELGFQLDRTNDRLDRVQTDTDQRFRELTAVPGTTPTAAGGEIAKTPPAPAEPVLSAASAAPTPGIASSTPGAEPAAPPSQAGTLGTLTGSDLAALQAGGAASTTVPPVTPTSPAPSAEIAAPVDSIAVLPAGTPEQQYRSAFDHLVKHDYDKAQTAFQAFVQVNPDDPLAGNAQYWLGETYYVRERYQEAAVAFLEGYQSYPESPKAADNLLKLGMALARIDRLDEACATFDKLQADFPAAPTNVKRRMFQERDRLQCGG